jgi:hypothetical protein
MLLSLDILCAMKRTDAGKTIRRELDLNAPPRSEQLDRLRALKDRKQIDYSDIPPVDGGVWMRPGALSTKGKRK